MSKKRMRELGALKEEALAKRLDDVRMELIKLRAQVGTGTVPKNPSQLRQARRTIARILTLKNQRRKTLTKE
jgi:large subunit ribosomal protein L29